jgi:hypothetical protein
MAIIAVGYWLYSLGSNSISSRAAIAERHGRAIAYLQTRLHLGWERSFNWFVARHEWLAQMLDYFYAFGYIVVTLGVLVWLYRCHTPVYRSARTVLILVTLFGLISFYLYPAAPPRLVPSLGYIDTVAKFHTWGSLAQPDIARHSNTFAAMPSLHFAWSLWCGIPLAMYARRGWVRALGVAYPAATFLAIIGTGNHYLLDALAGGIVVGLSFSIHRLATGHAALAPHVPTAERIPLA